VSNVWRRSNCTHGVTFDEGAAQEILDQAQALRKGDALDFILGNPACEEIRNRWPRGWFTQESPCPVCGFVGISYASVAHYRMGDW
jgi:hypothetical protein